MTRLQPETLVAASTERKQAARGIVPARRDDEHVCRPRLVRHLDMVSRGLQKCFADLVAGQLPWPLYLHGDIGTGKTRAALALCDQLEFARFWTLEEVIQAKLGRSSPWETVWGLPGGPRLVVLDEIGTHVKVSDLEYDALKMFADWREDTPVIYISNHPSAKMTELYDRRVASRLSCGTVHFLEGPDRRLRPSEEKT